MQHIAIVTAGGAGMFCGSCMHDNTWARALSNNGFDVTLIPTYTPVRVDEENLSVDNVFLGGISVYMEYRSRLWHRLPRSMTRWLDTPWIINLATKFGVSSNPHHLGALTLAMLDGENGPQQREVDELVTFISNGLQPDVVVFSNALLVGVLRRLREQYTGQILCTLQGDDIFLEGLKEPYRTSAITAIRERVGQFDGILVHSRFYQEKMSDYLGIPMEKFHVFPLGIDLHGHDGQPRPCQEEQFNVGYFARIAPEKGLLELVEAFRLLHERQPRARLLAGGYLGRDNRSYFRKVEKAAAPLGEAFRYIGSPGSYAEKVEFLKSLDVLSVPSPYLEPKGLYVLEALANGVPVVQPRHGAFPELIEATGGGLLVEPGNPAELAEAIESLMLDDARRLQLATDGHAHVHAKFGEAAMVEATRQLLAHSPAVVDSTP